MSRLLGLSGLAGSGKDTAAEALVALGWQRVAFADPVRALALALDPIVSQTNGYRSSGRTLRLSDLVRSYGWDVAKRTIPEVRRILEQVGNGARDVFDEHIWIDKAFDDIEFLSDKSYVIPDVRFPHEVEAIKKAGGVVARIVRPCLESSGTLTESALKDDDDCFHVILHNDRGIGELQDSMAGWDAVL